MSAQDQRMVSSEETARTLSGALDTLVWGVGFWYGLLFVYGSTGQSAEAFAVVCLSPMHSAWAQRDRDTSPAQSNALHLCQICSQYRWMISEALKVLGTWSFRLALLVSFVENLVLDATASQPPAMFGNILITLSISP